MKNKILIFAFIFLVIPGLKAAGIGKISEIMPSGTQLLSRQESPEKEADFDMAYKYGTTATKENILEFYQKFLLEEGYASTGKEINDKGSVFAFKKEGQTVAIAILAKQENELNIYYIILSEPSQRR